MRPKLKNIGLFTSETLKLPGLDNFCISSERPSRFRQLSYFFVKKIKEKFYGNGLAGGQIVSTVMWQQKVNNSSKNLYTKTRNTGVLGEFDLAELWGF